MQFAQEYFGEWIQSGSTTTQMLGSPKCAVYVWPRGATLQYAEQLAKDLGRDDLKVVSPIWLDDKNVRGRNLTGIVIDHATHLTYSQERCYYVALARIERRVQQ